MSASKETFSIVNQVVDLGTYRGQSMTLTVNAHQVDYGDFIDFTIEASCPRNMAPCNCDDGIHPFSKLEADDLDIDNPCMTGGVVADNACTRMLLKEICKVNETVWGHTGPQNIVCVLINAIVALWD